MSDILTIVISIAALVLAVASPMISSLINGIFRLKEQKQNIEAERKLKSLEFYQQHRAEVIERYISSAGKFCKHKAPASQEEFGAASGEIYLYVDEALWPLLDKIEFDLRQYEYETASNALIDLCKALSAYGVRSED